MSNPEGFDDLATRRRAPGTQSPGAPKPAGSGFGTQSQWRKPAPGGRHPQFTAPQPWGSQPAAGTQPVGTAAQLGQQPRPQQPRPQQPQVGQQPPFGQQPQQSAPRPAQPGQQPFGRPQGSPYPGGHPAPYASQFQQQPGAWPQQYPTGRPGAYPQGPYPQSGYPQGPYPQYPTPQPPRQKSLMPVVLVCIVAVVAVLAVVSQLSGGGTTDPTKRYENDDYQVPPAAGHHPDVPAPTSESQAMEWLEGNPFYQQDIAKPVRCELDDFDHTSATADQKKVQLEKTLECLVRLWGPTVEAAGFTITHPTVTMYSTETQGACGKMPMRNAFYCGHDQNLYFATDMHTLFGPKSGDPWAYEAVMAHEFGHSLQGRTGIIPARNYVLEDETSKEVAYLWVRRNEAQADCLAGLFFNSVQESMGLTPEDVQSIQDFYGQIGNKDPNRISTHPQPQTRYAWFQKGMTDTSVGVCNSYVVTAEEVK
ncbi:neutral zinc metallopeptidase [Propionibacteriaceae bacterium Y1923]